MANSNNASIGDNILQPGPFDGGSAPADIIGTLSAFEEIRFDGSNNVIDAAIASVAPGDVMSHTGNEGYGQPSATTVAATTGMSVTKYGRTTEATVGTVDATNATVDVCYQTQGPFRCKKLARYVGQVVITPGTFSDGGDSGSGIVTNDNNLNPVALLFAGSSSYTIANPIDAVLSAFNVTIDDGSGSTGGSGGGNSSPTASFTSSCSNLTCSFDGSGSSDDGSIASWDWDFGDGSPAESGPTPQHTYSGNGTYNVTLTVTDDEGATDTESQNVSVTQPATGQHVGDLDGSGQNNGSTWTAVVTITVHDANHSPVAGFSVTGLWSGPVAGSGDCITGPNGQCTVSRGGIRKRDGSVQYDVTNGSATDDNHDPDGDSDGTTITVTKP